MEKRLDLRDESGDYGQPHPQPKGGHDLVEAQDRTSIGGLYRQGGNKVPKSDGGEGDDCIIHALPIIPGLCPAEDDSWDQDEEDHRCQEEGEGSDAAGGGGPPATLDGLQTPVHPLLDDLADLCQEEQGQGNADDGVEDEEDLSRVSGRCYCPITCIGRGCGSYCIKAVGFNFLVPV